MGKAPITTMLCPLHTHTVYSVLDGASNIDQYIAWCKANGAPALGITDHGWAIGLAELYYKCKKAGLISLPGVEFYVAPDRDYKFAKKPFGYFHVTAFATTEAGYRNILKLASLSWSPDTLFGYRTEKGELVEAQVPRVIKRFGSEKPRITIAELLEHNEGIVLGSGCLIGLANKSWLQGEDEQAERNIEKLLSVYRGRFFAEIMPHIVDTDFDREQKAFKKNECTSFAPDGDVQKAVNLRLIELARKQRLPLLMSIDSHFVDHSEKVVQDCLLSQGDPSGWKFFGSYHMLTTDQAWEHWSNRYGSDEGNRKIFAEAVENNHLLADMAKDLKIEHRFHQPPPEVPQDIIEIAPTASEQRKLLLMRMIEKHGRMKWDDPTYTARLKMELSVICDNGVVDFSDYFLFLEKWCSWAQDNSIFTGAGRGSAGGSLLAYLLKITHLDPIEWKLPFERFLSKARINRGKFPDIDWDSAARDPIVAALKDAYGDRYAQISTHGTLKIKYALKDAARFLLGWPATDERIDAVTKSIPNTPMGVKDIDFLLGYKDQDGNHHPGHLDENPTLRRFFTMYPEVQEMVLKLLGIPRSIGRHASALVISDEPVSNTVPTCVVSGEPCTQYVASGDNYVEKSGLIKFDVLTVTTLKYAADAIRLIQRDFGYRVWKEKLELAGETFEVWKGELSIEQLPTGPKDDPGTKLLNVYRLPELPEVFRDLQESRTESLFQVSTPGMTDFCKRVKPTSTRDIAAIVALDRPGPLDAVLETDASGKPITMAEAYILRKAGMMRVTYAHPDLEPITRDTFGVLVYQEQQQRAFSEIAGYTSEEADHWREMLAKKKKQEVEKFIPELRKRLQEKGWTDEQAQVFVNACLAASQYSFNLAHAAAYAVDTYITAYLKNKHPLQWWTAVLQNAKVDHIKEKQYDRAVKDIMVLPHVNGPSTSFELIDGKIHAPLYLIDGLGDTASRGIEAAREDFFADLVQDGEGEVAARSLSEFGSLVEFLERTKKRKVNSKVVQNLIVCGGFAQIEPDRTPQELLELHYYITRVSGLKAGKDKTGLDLVDAALAYRAQHPEEAKENVPYLKLNEYERESLKLDLLPIYHSDVHEVFRSMLERYLYYDQTPPYMMLEREKIEVVLTMRDATARLRDITKRSRPAIWCGLARNGRDFSYNDKKTGARVTAHKFDVVNNGESMECVIWPNTLDQLGRPFGMGPIIVMGSLKDSKQAGQCQVFVSQFQEISPN